MKSYPSIDGQVVKSKPYWIQNKKDGSNLRASWQRKKGFHLFGSRTQLVDETNPLGRIGIPLFKAKYTEALDAIFRKERFEEVVCFFELFGPSSFAGVHNFDELGFDVCLFDINVHKKGMIHPKEFYKLMEGLPVVELLYQGNITEELIQSIKSGTLEGMDFEGVVCKGSPLKNGFPPHMFKVKSEAWVVKVKSLYSDPEKLKELL